MMFFFSKKPGENFHLAKIFLNVRVRLKLNLRKNLVLHLAFKVKPLIKRFVSFCRMNTLKYVYFMSHLKYRCIEERNTYHLFVIYYYLCTSKFFNNLD